MHNIVTVINTVNSRLEHNVAQYRCSMSIGQSHLSDCCTSKLNFPVSDIGHAGSVSTDDHQAALG